MPPDAGSEEPGHPAKKTTRRRRSTRTAKRTTAKRATARAASTTRKTAARKTTARKTTSRRRGVTTGQLASSLAVLMEQLDAQIASINGLSDTIDAHVATLNELRADQQLQVAALLEVREAAGRDGTLASYIDERLAELRRPVVNEAELPWPRH
jgi:hypothetical protein